MSKKFEYYETSDGWRWKLKGRNGEIQASGEGYATKASVKRGVKSVRGKNIDWDIVEVNHSQIGNLVEHTTDAVDC